MSYFSETMGNLLHQTAFFNLTWGNFVMIIVACFFLYLAIAKGFEPLLLVPIAFGMLLVNIYPDIIAEEANPDMPESVRRLYEEAGLIYNKSPRAACALLRLAVENLCQELGQVDRDINKNIAALVQNGLSPSIQKALDTVRVVGNKAVHPGQIAIDVDDVNTAKMLMRLLNMIVERMITEPKELEEVYGLLPKSAREAIERRDQ